MCRVRSKWLWYVLLLSALASALNFSVAVLVESPCLTLIMSTLLHACVAGGVLGRDMLWSFHILCAIWGAQSEDSHPCKSRGSMWIVDCRREHISRSDSVRMRSSSSSNDMNFPMTAQMSVQTSDVDMLWPAVLSRISLMMNRNLSVMSWTESFLLAGLNNPSFRMALMDFEMFHRRVGDLLGRLCRRGGFRLGWSCDSW